MKRKLYKFCLDGEQSRVCSKLCKRYASARVWGIIVVSLAVLIVGVFIMVVRSS